MESLKKAARVSSFTIVGDSKLISQGNMLFLSIRRLFVISSEAGFVLTCARW